MRTDVFDTKSEHKLSICPSVRPGHVVIDGAAYHTQTLVSAIITATFFNTQTEPKPTEPETIP